MQPPKYLLVKNNQLYIYKNRLAHKLANSLIKTAQVPGNNIISNEVDIEYINSHQRNVQDENALFEDGFIVEYEHDTSISTIGIVGYEGNPFSNPSEVDLIEIYIYHMVDFNGRLKKARQFHKSKNNILCREYMLFLPVHRLIPSRQNFIDFKSIALYKKDILNASPETLAKQASETTRHYIMKLCHQPDPESETDIY